MAELSLRERLQPALIDRLTDDERLMTIFEFEVSRGELARLRLGEREWLDILEAQGLRRMTASENSARMGPDAAVWTLCAPTGKVSLAQLKALVLRPPGAPGGIAVQEFCRIEARNVPNDTVESADRRAISMRRLREYVLRDVGALLNALNLEMTVDLARFSRVQGSVINFGTRSLAGLAAVAVDPVETATAIEKAIRRFEPRLRKVRVSPETREESEGHQLWFRIDAELWGQPVPQQLVLRTRIETDSGNVTVDEQGSG